MYGSTEPWKFHTDGSDELRWACRILNFRGHTTSAPGEWQSNGLIETDVGLTKGGVRAARAQAGLPSKAWPWTGRHWAFATNIHTVTNPQNHLFGSSPWKERYGSDFPGLRIPHGAKVLFCSAPNVPRVDAYDGISGDSKASSCTGH